MKNQRHPYFIVHVVDTRFKNPDGSFRIRSSMHVQAADEEKAAVRARECLGAPGYIDFQVKGIAQR